MKMEPPGTSLVGCSWHDGPFFFDTVGCSSASHHQLTAESDGVSRAVSSSFFERQDCHFANKFGIAWNLEYFFPLQFDFQSHPSEFPQPIFENESEMIWNESQISSIVIDFQTNGSHALASYWQVGPPMMRRTPPMPEEDTLHCQGIAWCAQQVDICCNLSLSDMIRYDHQIWSDVICWLLPHLNTLNRQRYVKRCKEAVSGKVRSCIVILGINISAESSWLWGFRTAWNCLDLDQGLEDWSKLIRRLNSQSSPDLLTWHEMQTAAAESRSYAPTMSYLLTFIWFAVCGFLVNTSFSHEIYWRLLNCNQWCALRITCTFE